jgi:XTP/dITP diphosphohydrolase
LGTGKTILNMRRLVFATNNLHKLKEVAAKTGGRFELLTLNDIGCEEDIAETGTTFQENAAIKSRFVFDNYHLDCFADDSGLEVDALGGEPGVYSARYSGKHGDSGANMDKLLHTLGDNLNRTARFRTVISLMLGGQEYFFEGKVEGTIRHQRAGNAGFGYDPIFQPDGYLITFAEMSLDEKNRISHRAQAVAKLVDFLAVTNLH